MKRCSRPSPLSPLSPLGTKDTCKDTVSSEETKKENVRTLKQASSEKSVFSELRKKEGKKIRCTTPKRIIAFGADNNVEYGSDGSDGSDDVDDVDDVDGAPTSKVADTERASEAASDHDEDPNTSLIVRCVNYFSLSKYCRMVNVAFLHVKPYLSAFTLFILLIFVFWSLELYKIGQICGEKDLKKMNVTSIPMFFYVKRCQFSWLLQPIVPEQITEYTYKYFDAFFQFMISIPGGSSFISILRALTPGIMATKCLDLVLFLYETTSDELSFSKMGFQNRVSITINTLQKRVRRKDHRSSSKRYRNVEFEMRTIRDIDLADLVPNKAAQRAIKNAGENVLLNECGPTEHFEIEKPCISCNNSFVQKYICCIRTVKTKNYQPGGCCCCVHRCNWGWKGIYPCGKSKEYEIRCDPILRFPTNPASERMKKFVQDQIVNVLSESTSGSHFMGWEMGMSYKKIKYCWALTYEQPMVKTEKDARLGPSTRASATTSNRKFRILVAQKQLVDFATENDSLNGWEVFHDKENFEYTRYCDRRWSHLRKIGLMLQAKKDPNYPKDQLKKLNSFFMGDDLEVVSPMITVNGKVEDEGYRLEQVIKDWKAGGKRKT
jgi:hypothetical protein